ncbi:MAG: hypothetical protein QF828_15440 [Pseudomonadales bacterium]|nr:hypothetical protein [Pseudomonadales bacterium]|tara:strand:- start:1760 stop:1927 length:168 start_codon:yes stop_codon:yes gene_type:complete
MQREQTPEDIGRATGQALSIDGGQVICIQCAVPQFTDRDCYALPGTDYADRTMTT